MLVEGKGSSPLHSERAAHLHNGRQDEHQGRLRDRLWELGEGTLVLVPASASTGCPCPARDDRLVNRMDWTP